MFNSYALHTYDATYSLSLKLQRQYISPLLPEFFLNYVVFRDITKDRLFSSTNS